jgi:hypothetical protein
MQRHRNRSETEIMQEVSRHHCRAIMSRQAAEFRARFSEDEWVIDIGGGTGWYWRGTRGAKILLADFSRESLQVASTLLRREDRVLPLHCDASALPLRAGTMSGVWSVQVFQHLPPAILAAVLAELRRTLQPDFGAKIFNLNPAWLLRAAYRLAGRKYHRTGDLHGVLLDCLDRDEWRHRLAPWLSAVAAPRVSAGFSELFFHPPLRLTPEPYPVTLERVITAWNGLAELFARQVHIEVARPTPRG